MNIVLIIISLFFVLIPLCTNLTNPYKNRDESKVVIMESSFKNGDTVKIDTLLKIVVTVELFEYINFFKVQAPGNTLWTDSLIMVNGNKIKPISLSLSFNKTGLQEITIVTYFRDKCVTTRKYYLHVI